MAGEDILTEGQLSTTTSHMSIQQIRALAQSHLRDIKKEISTEAQQQATAQQEVQRYMKPRRKERAGPQSSHHLATTFEAVKGPKLRSAQDVLHRLQWDPTINLAEYMVGYLERFEGIKEMPVANWVRESTDEEFIPQHRIKYVKRMTENGEDIVWDRDGRVDKIFGYGIANEAVTEDGKSEGGVVL